MTVKMKFNYYYHGLGLFDKKTPAFAGGLIPTKFFWNFAGPEGKTPAFAGVFLIFICMFTQPCIMTEKLHTDPRRIPH